MEKKQNKKTEKKFQKLLANYIKIKKEKEFLASATKQNICMLKQMKQLKKNNEFAKKSLLEKKAKLGKINTRNLNKRLKKRDMTIKKLKKERFILEKLPNVEVGRLPKVTFVKDMFLEARALSQIQLVSVLTENTDDNLTLHSNGTSKHGHCYTSLDVKKRGCSCYGINGSGRG